MRFLLPRVLLAASTVAVCAAAPAVAQGPPPPSAVPEAPIRYDPDHLPAAFHLGRRQALMDALPDSAIAVVLGGVEGGGSVDDLREFHQDPYLYYLTGTLEAGSALLLAPGGMEVDGEVVREVLFVPPRSPSMEMWLGRRFGPERAARVLGVERAISYQRFDEIVEPLLAAPGRAVYLLPLPEAVAPSTTLARQMGLLAAVAGERDGAFDDTTLVRVLDDMRAVKTDAEVALLRRAVDITAEAQREAMSAMGPGWAEYEIEAVVEYSFRRMGSERPGFPSIVASGENSVLLHYDTNRRVTRDGDLVVMDLGASYRGYTADVTRTVPVNGRFSPEQRAVYEIVLEAQEAGIAAAKAGASFGAPGQAASRVLAGGLAQLGLLDDPDDVRGLRRFFPHGTSHYLGLQVHDVGPYRALAEGVVITVEPGIYIAPADDIDPKWWNVGVRIEDDVLVTRDGPVVLSAGAPKDPDEIERLMGGF